MAFQVIIRPKARTDVSAVVRWLARTSPAAAARWRTGLLQIVENLETDPTRYPEADEAADLGCGLRVLLYGRRRNVYRILFTIDGQTVNVLRIRHAAHTSLLTMSSSIFKGPVAPARYCSAPGRWRRRNGQGPLGIEAKAMLKMALMSCGKSRLPQQQINHPAPTNMLPF